MTNNYDISDSAWNLISDLAEKKQTTGRPRRHDRTMLDGIMYVLYTGIPWRALPERFGPWTTVYQRFRDWRDDGTFDKIFQRLQFLLNSDGKIDAQVWALDSTISRATKAASGKQKK